MARGEERGLVCQPPSFRAAGLARVARDAGGDAQADGRTCQPSLAGGSRSHSVRTAPEEQRAPLKSRAPQSQARTERPGLGAVARASAASIRRAPRLAEIEYPDYKHGSTWIRRELEANREGKPPLPRPVARLPQERAESYGRSRCTPAREVLRELRVRPKNQASSADRRHARRRSYGVKVTASALLRLAPSVPSGSR